jgi:AcrR family transcriptional regulator
MSPTERARARRRAPLSRERILDAAVALADGEGLDSLTMRKLAAQLHVEAMSLYNHVANKDDLLDGMIDQVAAEIVAAPEGADWRARLRARALSAHDALLRHRWSSVLWASRTTLGPARMRHMDAMLRELREAGFGIELLDVAFHTLENHVVGHALQASSFPVETADVPEMIRAFLASFPEDDYPDLAAHVRHHAAPSASDVSSFAFGLDAILDALATRLDAAPGSA